MRRHDKPDPKWMLIGWVFNRLSNPTVYRTVFRAGGMQVKEVRRETPQTLVLKVQDGDVLRTFVVKINERHLTQ